MKVKEYLIGKFITLYGKSGHVYEGVIKEITEDKIELKSPSGKSINISIREIEAYEVLISDTTREIVKEKSVKDPIPQHDPKDIKSLVELRKMKSNEEIKSIRRKLKSADVSNKEVEYGSTLSALAAVKKY